MINNPENDKLNDSVQEIETDGNAQRDDFSTVFSDPAEHTKRTPAKKGKSRLIAVISSLLAVAILVGGTVAVIKLIPEKTDDTTSSEFEEIKVLDLKSEDFNSVTVKNKNGTFKLYSKVEKTESDSSDTSSTSTTTKWYVDGYDDELLNTSLIGNIAGAAASVTATREITEKSASECGLESPSATIDVVTKDDANYSILVGSESPDNTGTYLKLSTSDKIYIVEDSLAEEFDFDILSLANTDSLPGITLTSEMSNYKDSDGNLSTFDSLTVNGKNFPQELVLVPNTDTRINQYAAYLTTSPTKRIADNVDSLITLFKSGVSVSGAYSLDASAASLSAFGLDSPDFTATMKILNSEYTFRFKLQEDGNYAAICSNGKMIKKVPASNLSFINYGTNDFYASWVCLQSIDDISNFAVKTPEKEYSFDIEKQTDDDGGSNYNITYNGKKLTASDFQTYYQYCISLSCADYTVDKLTSEPDLTITFTYNDTNNAPCVVEFRKASETKYQYSVDGIAMGKITSSAFNKIEKYTQKIADGGSIN